MVHIIKKRRYVVFGIAALLIVAGVTAFGRIADARGRRGRGNVLHLVVRNDPGGTFSFSSPDGGITGQKGAFYIQGDIFRAGDVNQVDSLGPFRCWGWIVTPGQSAVVSQEFDLGEWGTLEVQGSEMPRPAELAIVGGTGNLAGASGTVVLGAIDPATQTFSATVRLVKGGFHHGGDDD